MGELQRENPKILAFLKDVFGEETYESRNYYKVCLTYMHSLFRQPDFVYAIKKVYGMYRTVKKGDQSVDEFDWSEPIEKEAGERRKRRLRAEAEVAASQNLLRLVRPIRTGVNLG